MPLLLGAITFFKGIFYSISQVYNIPIDKIPLYFLSPLDNLTEEDQLIIWAARVWWISAWRMENETWGEFVLIWHEELNILGNNKRFVYL